MKNLLSFEHSPLDTFLEQEFSEHRRALDSTAALVAPAFERTLEIWRAALVDGGKLIFFGNGGSACDAQHVAAELVVRYRDDRSPIAALALTCDSAVMTACANDLGYEQVFARQLQALGSPRDVAIGISTSGKSPNVLRALTVARTLGLRTTGMCGDSPECMQELCDALISIPCSVTARVQEMHVTLGHMLCKALERRLLAVHVCT